MSLKDVFFQSNFLNFRVVTLSFAPFIVVHVNTSYTRLTGYSSAKVLGRPLHECVGGKSKDWLESSGKVRHPVALLHDRISIISSRGSRITKCRVKVALVGQQLEGKREVDTNTITHYSVCFLTHEGSKSEASSKTGSGAPEVGHHLVMG